MINIRAKLVLWISALFIFIGLLIYLPLSVILPERITAQIIKKDVEIAKYLADKAKEPILLSDKIALSLLLYDNLERLDDARYLFIRSSDGAIISHTFRGGFPSGLVSFNPANQNPWNVKSFLNNNEKIYDIAAPISGDELGTLHLGVSMGSSMKDIAAIKKVNYYVAVVMLLGLGIGILIFNDMSRRLKEKIEEIKRLNTIDERNRIALDLHDGRAQDLASIIKRCELCEKLFSINPAKALEEVKELKGITRTILDKTREMIFDLKSPHGNSFNLADGLLDYIESYRKENNIFVKSVIPDSLGSIPPVAARSIFYIIKEAFTNAWKHSHAENIELNLEMAGERLTIDIRDDGAGFDVDKALRYASAHAQLGLKGMRERTSSLDGSFSIKSEIGQGTEISVIIPL